jgi:hypothetical protein
MLLPHMLLPQKCFFSPSSEKQAKLLIIELKLQNLLRMLLPRMLLPRMPPQPSARDSQLHRILLLTLLLNLLLTLLHIQAMLLPRMPPQPSGRDAQLQPIDLDCCLVHQKLQLLNICILKKRHAQVYWLYW